MVDKIRFMYVRRKETVVLCFPNPRNLVLCSQKDATKPSSSLHPIHTASPSLFPIQYTPKFQEQKGISLAKIQQQNTRALHIERPNFRNSAPNLPINQRSHHPNHPNHPNPPRDPQPTYLQLSVQFLRQIIRNISFRGRLGGLDRLRLCIQHDQHLDALSRSSRDPVAAIYEREGAIAGSK